MSITTKSVRSMMAAQATRAIARILAVLICVIPWMLSNPAFADQPVSSIAQERSGGALGIGVSLGDLDGMTFKYWSSPIHAFQLRVGSMSQLNSLGIAATYQYHFRPVQVPDNAFSLPFYIGGGPHFSVASTTTTYMDDDFSVASTTTTYMDGGFTMVFGMNVLIPELPIDLYYEIRPTLVFTDMSVGTTSSLGLGFQIEGGLGAHFYF